MNSTAKDALTGNLACLAAYLIFGFNIVCCKNIANDGHVPPMSLFLMRSAGALVLFWVMSLCLPEARRERVERGDLWKIAVASLLGLFLTQFAFLKAITMTTAVDASVLGLMTPVMTMVVAAVVLKDRITWQGVLGLGVSLAGVLSIEYGAIPWDIVLQILYVVVGATFVAYFLIPVGQKRLKPVLVCMYSYVQPVVAMCISLAVGLDTMTWAKGVATVLVFAGVGIVNFSPHAHHHAKALHHSI